MTKTMDMPATETKTEDYKSPVRYGSSRTYEYVMNAINEGRAEKTTSTLSSAKTKLNVLNGLKSYVNTEMEANHRALRNTAIAAVSIYAGAVGMSVTGAVYGLPELATASWVTIAAATTAALTGIAWYRSKLNSMRRLADSIIKGVSSKQEGGQEQ